VSWAPEQQIRLRPAAEHIAALVAFELVGTTLRSLCDVVTRAGGDTDAERSTGKVDRIVAIARRDGQRVERNDDVTAGERATHFVRRQRRAVSAWCDRRRRIAHEETGRRLASNDDGVCLACGGGVMKERLRARPRRGRRDFDLGRSCQRMGSCSEHGRGSGHSD
jgi:RNA polymerase-binding transcription factor DksA